MGFKQAASPTPEAGHTLKGLTRLRLTMVLRLADRMRLGLVVGRAERVGVAREHLRRVRIEAKGHHHRHHGRKVRVGEQWLLLWQVLLVPWGRRLRLAGCLLLRRLAALRLGGRLGVLLDLQGARAADHGAWAVPADTAPRRARFTVAYQVDRDVGQSRRVQLRDPHSLLPGRWCLPVGAGAAAAGTAGAGGCLLASSRQWPAHQMAVRHSRWDDNCRRNGEGRHKCCLPVHPYEACPTSRQAQPVPPQHQQETGASASGYDA